MTTDLDLPTLDRLHASATPAPWGIYSEPVDSVQAAIVELARLATGTVDPVGEIQMLATYDEPALCPATTGIGPKSKANAELIVALVNAFPSLSARLKELEDSNAQLQKLAWKALQGDVVEPGRVVLLEETLRGILQEKRDALNKGGDFEYRDKLYKEIAWLEQVLRGDK